MAVNSGWGSICVQEKLVHNMLEEIGKKLASENEAYSGVEGVRDDWQEKLF